MCPDNPFKTCTCCGFVWNTREEFLRDPDIQIVGYQVNYAELKAGLFLFNHVCNSTLALEVEDFTDLYSGPIFSASLSGSEICQGFCHTHGDLRHCPEKCECAFVREIIQIVKTYQKAA